MASNGTVKLQKGDVRVSGNWRQVWNGKQWISTKKVSPSAPTVGVDPIFKEPFKTQAQQEAEARRFVEMTTTPDSAIVEQGQRSLTGAENIGKQFGESQRSLQEGLGTGLSALAQSTRGMAGSNLYSGLQSAQMLQSATPGIQANALVAGTKGQINATTRDLLQKAGQERRTALANRLNELFKRETDKSTGREQSRLTRETIGSKAAIAAANRDLAAAKFKVQTDIAYRRLQIAADKAASSGSTSTKNLLKDARATARTLLNSTTSTPDGTIGHIVIIRDPITQTTSRKWYAGNWEQVKNAAKNEYGSELLDTDISPVGGPQANPNARKTSKQKYTKNQVRESMIKWVMENIPGYSNRAVAAAVVDGWPEMQLAS